MYSNIGQIFSKKQEDRCSIEEVAYDYIKISDESKEATMRKILMIVLTVSLIGSMAFANGGSESETPELRVLLSDDMLEGGGFHTLAEMYTEETGIPIEVIEIPYSDLPAKLANMIRAGNSPNVVRTTSLLGFEDFLLDLTGTFDESIILPARLPSSKYNGKLVALPSNVTANGMLYNKSAFEAAGVDVPTGADDLWSWNEFVEAVQKVTAMTDVEYPLVWDHSQHRYATLLYQFGGSFYSEDLTKVRIANDKALKSLEFFLSLFDDGVMPKSVWVGSEDPSAMFKTGQVAVHMSGNWKVSDYNENIKDFEWGAVRMPYQERRSSVLGGNYVIGVTDTGLEQETKDFLTWFYSPDVYTKYCEMNLYLPGRTGIVPDYSVPSLAVFADELENTPAVAGTDWSTGSKYPGVSWGNALRDNIDLAIVGDISPDEALLNTEKVIVETFVGITPER